jgi:hypothetical protein
VNGKEPLWKLAKVAQGVLLEEEGERYELSVWEKEDCRKALFERAVLWGLPDVNDVDPSLSKGVQNAKTLPGTSQVRLFALPVASYDVFVVFYAIGATPGLGHHRPIHRPFSKHHEASSSVLTARWTL